MAKPAAPPATPTGSPLHAALGRARPMATAVGLLLPLLWVLVAAALLVLAAAAGVRWVLVTEAGSRWLLTHLPYVHASDWQGALLGERWQARQLRIEWDGGRKWLLLDDVQAEGVRVRWRPADGAARTWLGISADRVQARQGELHMGPRGPQPPRLPLSLALPVQVTVQQVAAQSFRIDTLAPFLEAEVQGLRIDSRPGAGYTAERIRGQWHGLVIDGQASLGHAQPLPLQASATLTRVAEGDARTWAAVVQAEGPLQALDVRAILRGVPRPGHAAPALDLQAQVLLLQRWPLGRLQVTTTALDLSALHAAAPQTRLSGSAELRSREANAPLSATVQLQNAQPGRWNEGLLPVARLNLELAGRPEDPRQLDAPRFELQLAEGSGARSSGSAGSLTGSARWQGHQLQLDTRLTDVAPQRLDSRAATMRLSGPLLLTLDGLPSPDPANHAAPPPWRAQWQLDLEGRLEASPQPVQLKLQGSADAQRVQLQQVRAQTGAAVADLTASLQRAARGDWQLSTAGSLVGFDPLPWFPGDIGSAWRQGPHRLSGSWTLDLQVPGDLRALVRRSPLAAGQRMGGNGSLRISESVLAGVPLSGEAVLTYAPRIAASSGQGAPAADGGTATVRAEVRLGGNSLQLDGQGDPAPTGGAGRLRATLQAPQLAALAPLARLHPSLAEWVPRAGTAQLDFSAAGRWPELRTEGSARVQRLQVGSWSLARGQADWQLDNQDHKPLVMRLDLAGLQRGTQRAEQLRGTVLGTLAAHRIDLEALLPLAPAGAGAQLLAGVPATGTRALLRAQGAWAADPAGGGRWRTQIERLLVAGWDRRTLEAAATSPAGSAPPPTVATAITPAGPVAAWADASDLRAELQFDASGALAVLTAEPGRLRLADTATLRWDAVRLDWQGAQPRISLRAEIEPFALAPLLARLQPDMGWQGSLRLAGRVQVQAEERFQADLLFERVSGDLQLAGVDSAQAMGLSELRLALTARDGQWTVAPAIAGQTLGELRGTMQLSTKPEARWPGPEAALDGSLQLRVADIGIWNAWIPPGWRMSGSVQGMAALGGRFGDPRFTGELQGSKLALRNLLQGVNVRDGEVTVRLDGETARIERFALRGGEGTLTVEGNAQLGSRPVATLQLKAERFRVLGRIDQQLIASGTAQALLTANSIRVDGSLRADEGLFDTTRAGAPTLDSDVTVRRLAEEEVPVVDLAAERQRAAWVIATDLSLDLGENLRVRGAGLDTVLQGRLRLTTPGSRLALSGSIRTVGGTYTGYGQKMDIARGIVAFSGSLDTARLDILALRPNLDIKVGVAITGPRLAPRVRLFSDPEMSENEKLSWLMLGRAPSGLGRNDAALLQRAAVALLAGQGEAPTDALLRNLGIDELTLKSGEGDVRETVISLGKQLSRRWYVGYERGVNSTTGTWQLIYRIAQRFTLRAQSGLDNSLDAIWILRLGETPPQPESGPVRKSVPLPP